jgi:hypothetical protein
MEPRRIVALFTLLMLATSGTRSWQAPPQGPTGTGLILGRVVDADAGRPVSAVVVTAVASADPFTIPPAGRPQSMLTDAQGRFVFRNLPKATYSLIATTGGNGYSPSGFIVTGRGHQIGAYLDGGYGQRRPNGPLQTIDLADGERIGDAVIRLWKGGAITGRVLDEAGEALVDVVVAAVQRSGDGRLLTGPTARTDDRGVYRLATLTPGSYLVVVPQTQLLMPSSTIESLLAGPPNPTGGPRFFDTGAPTPPQRQPPGSGWDAGLRVGSSTMITTQQGRVTNFPLPSRRADRLYAYPTMFFPSAVVASRATPILLRSGEERSDVDVQLQPVRTVEVSGTLMDSSGPVPHFGVHLMPADAGDGASVMEVATTSTDARGAFVFPLVPAGSHRLVALRTDPVPGEGSSPPAEPRRVSETLGAWAIQPLTVGDANVGNVGLTLRSGVHIAGRLEFSGASERPAASRLKQVVPITVIRAQPLFRANFGPSEVPLDPTGGFSSRALSPGRYLVGVQVREAAATWTLQSVTAGGRDVTDAVMTIGDTDVNDVVVVVTDQPATLNGTVSNAKGSADLDASVFVFPADKARWPDARTSTRAFRTVRVSKTGAFTVPTMIPGEYFVVAASDQSTADWPDEQLLAKLAALASSVRVEPNQKQTVNLRTVTVR